MIDFDKLRSEPSGFRGAFEGLVCQLGRRHPPADSKQFVTIHGAGGDGGLEAYWISSKGTEHGYQAKFHTKSGDIDWGKIDGSVSAGASFSPKFVTHGHRDNLRSYRQCPGTPWKIWTNPLERTSEQMGV